ncbi:MaoC family dehydratase [Thermogemmatispora sp.]|uniref:MaoC family dehydratase n=1 Tax=Thermogemmatispora sp. TaxID=1968838 RepID=UPI001D61575F|nr:MaoC family dehydratase [Thermogemmatispora sp.]MBX5450653.1 MaoC family dehydratase [Thermogemmatispora sp.]
MDSERKEPLQVGDVLTYERTFSEEDIRLFAALSGDKGHHHMHPDAQGRLMVHGLLTASIPTKLGGDLNFIARSMQMEFLRPVFAGDRVRCEMTVSRLEPGDGYLALELVSICRNQHGKEVLRGQAQGIIRQRPSSASEQASNEEKAS